MPDEEEVKLSADNQDSDEYEIIPMGPVRKLEKRIDELEEQKSQSMSGNENLVRDILDIMKANQKIVNDMVQSNTELHNSIEELTTKMDKVMGNMSDFMGLLEEASEASLEEDVSANLSEDLVSPISDSMENLKHTNEKMLEGLGKIDESLNQLDKRMKRLYASQRSSSNRGTTRQSSRGQSQ
ncbi:MAG: hypothetical protein MUP58_00070 [Candidatus Nanohaloarchaeota archaeon QJJ-9]|nr:hypothetical protein [Candidatus Nanohaloarchaeota archaeon QJJ-9]